MARWLSPLPRRCFPWAPRNIQVIFLVQGVMIGLAGVLVGITLGVLLAMNLETLIHGLEALTGTHFLDAKVYFMSDLPAQVQLTDVARVSIVALLLCIVATVYPAWRASRLAPAEVLRHD